MHLNAHLFGVFQIILMSTITIRAQKNLFCFYQILKSNEFSFNDLDLTFCSHLIYDDFKINEMGYFVYNQEEFINGEINENDVLGKLTILKLKYPNLKILASIGQLNSNPIFSSMLSSEIKRTNFLESTIKFLTSHEFDGLDFGWTLGNNYNDKINYATLAKKLNDNLTKNKKLFVLCVEPNPVYATNLYDIQEIAKYANFVIMRTFEMNRDFNKVGFDAALYPHYDNDPNIKTSVEFWLNEGVPAEKIIIHISTIGRKYTLINKNLTYLGAPADSTKKPDSSVYYNKFCNEIKNNTKWMEIWDDTQKAPYAFTSDIWINYDNMKSVKLKTEFISDLKLGGISFGPLQYDDYNGSCKTGKYPLLNTIHSNLKIFSNEYKYIVNVTVIKRHLRSGQAEKIYDKEETFDLLSL